MKHIVSLIVMLQAASTAETTSFAVECEGTSISRGSFVGSDYERSNELGRQVFVFDPASEEMSRALFPRQEFDPICGGQESTRFVSFSPGLLQASSYNGFGADPHETCEFQLDRMSGSGTYLLKMKWADGRFHELEWNFECRSTEIPEFNLRDRKF